VWGRKLIYTSINQELSKHYTATQLYFAPGLDDVDFIFFLSENYFEKCFIFIPFAFPTIFYLSLLLLLSLLCPFSFIYNLNSILFPSYTSSFTFIT
jgi:hypothetical protein